MADGVRALPVVTSPCRKFSPPPPQPSVVQPCTTDNVTTAALDLVTMLYDNLSNRTEDQSSTLPTFKIDSSFLVVEDSEAEYHRTTTSATSKKQQTRAILEVFGTPLMCSTPDLASGDKLNNSFDESNSYCELNHREQPVDLCLEYRSPAASSPASPGVWQGDISNSRDSTRCPSPGPLLTQAAQDLSHQVRLSYLN